MFISLDEIFYRYKDKLNMVGVLGIIFSMLLIVLGMSISAGLFYTDEAPILLNGSVPYSLYTLFYYRSQIDDYREVGSYIDFVTSENGAEAHEFQWLYVLYIVFLIGLCILLYIVSYFRRKNFYNYYGLGKKFKKKIKPTFHYSRVVIAIILSFVSIIFPLYSYVLIESIPALYHVSSYEIVSVEMNAGFVALCYIFAIFASLINGAFAFIREKMIIISYDELQKINYENVKIENEIQENKKIEDEIQENEIVENNENFSWEKFEEKLQSKKPKKERKKLNLKFSNLTYIIVASILSILSLVGLLIEINVFRNGNYSSFSYTEIIYPVALIGFLISMPIYRFVKYKNNVSIIINDVLIGLISFYSFIFVFNIHLLFLNFIANL